MSILKLDNGVVIPIHWNDRYYESPECAECGITLMERTTAELKQSIQEHNCSQPG